MHLASRELKAYLHNSGMYSIALQKGDPHLWVIFLGGIRAKKVTHICGSLFREDFGARRGTLLCGSLVGHFWVPVKSGHTQSWWLRWAAFNFAERPQDIGPA